MPNAITLSDGKKVEGSGLPVQVSAVADTSQIAAAIEEGVNTFMETVPALIKALDEVAKVHPFISGTDEPAPRTCVLA